MLFIRTEVIMRQTQETQENFKFILLWLWCTTDKTHFISPERRNKKYTLASNAARRRQDKLILPMRKEKTK